MPFQYDPKISFGNIVTICMVVVGALSAFIAVQYQVSELERRMERMQSDVQERAQRIELSANAYESRIRAARPRADRRPQLPRRVAGGCVEATHDAGIA